MSEQVWTRAFSPLRRVDGYLPIEDHGLIGDCTTAALVARDGSVNWLCAPRFDSDAVFAALLDHRRGGHFRIAPSAVRESRQRYIDDTAVLQTELRSECGLVRITDACTVHRGADLSEDATHARGELLRVVDVLEGSVTLEIEIAPRGGAVAEPAVAALRIRCERFPGLKMRLSGSCNLDGLQGRLHARAGERHWFLLRWGNAVSTRAADPMGLLDDTAAAWRRWMRGFDYRGPQYDLVRRSALVLKLLDYSRNGAMIAAPTSSLPEMLGGERNWDYRYAWIRDAAFSVYALRRIGLSAEGDSFLSWVLDIVEQGKRPRVLYNLDGEQPAPEAEDVELEGYRRSRPVRWGNAAADQRQHDVYGEILDCAYQWATHDAAIDVRLWERLRACVRNALAEWDQPDHGIWEVRTSGHVFTYSAALCQVALDRGARLSERYRLPGESDAWFAAARQIREAILERAWDEHRQSLTEHLGGGNLDASLLCLPLRRVISATHPKMVATCAAVERELGAGRGLLYRYLPAESPDGIAGEEGAFLLCSFWLVDNYAKQGRLDDACTLYDTLCSRAGPLGLLPEQIDPASGAFLGNYPQAFSHVGVIASGINLSRSLQARERQEQRY